MNEIKKNEVEGSKFKKIYQELHLKLKGEIDATDMPEIFEKKIKRLFNSSLPLKLERNSLTSKFYDNGAKMYNKAVDNVKDMVHLLLFDKKG